MAEPMQLTIDGREVSMRESTRKPILTEGQRWILAHARLAGTAGIGTLEAGLCLGWALPRTAEHRAHVKAAGAAALRRLAARRLLVKVARGVWRAV
jgi:hypothetical protein